MEQYPVWTPYAERAVSPTSYWTSEEDNIQVVSDLGAQWVEGVGRESLTGEISQSLSPLNQEPQMEVVTTADESLSREPHRTVQMVVGETLLECFERLEGKGMFNQPSFDQCLRRLRPLKRPNHRTWTSNK